MAPPRRSGAARAGRRRERGRRTGTDAAGGAIPGSGGLPGAKLAWAFAAREERLRLFPPSVLLSFKGRSGSLFLPRLPLPLPSPGALARSAPAGTGRKGRATGSLPALPAPQAGRTSASSARGQVPRRCGASRRAGSSLPAPSPSLEPEGSPPPPPDGRPEVAMGPAASAGTGRRAGEGWGGDGRKP